MPTSANNPKEDVTYHRILFTIPFRSEMGPKDIKVLVSILHLNLCLQPKSRWVATKPGIRRLDRDSGLVLLYGPEEGTWVLEGRTWGNPPEKFVEAWRLQAATVALRLDPDVSFPAWTDLPL